MINLILITMAVSFSSFAEITALEEEILLGPVSPKNLTTGAIERNKQLYLYKESVLEQDMDGYSEEFFTGEDKNRLSLSYQFSANVRDFVELNSIELILSRELQDYANTWISVMAKRTTGKYEAFADDIDTSNGANSRKGTDQTFTTFGAGAGYRFKALTAVFESSRVFETVDAFLTYNTHVDGLDSESYQGFGIQTDYGLHRRSGRSFYYGGKLSYNIASLARSKKGDEKLEDRSLVFGWLSMGFEMGYYY
ncbi:MAG: hypothetical protein CME64_02920 [Halobacteriovoraceae bacterium]|nr:hypothetical protein [Halobacteriovoraceae bacterium]|tara:strand:+ start:20298 stop:21053 length:756 start_codon:yes stop_codon:yes gene_type:complete